MTDPQPEQPPPPLQSEERKTRMIVSLEMVPRPLEPGKMDINVEMPNEIAKAWVMWKMLGDAILNEAMGVELPQEQRIVRPDGFGVNPRRRIRG